MTKNKNRLLIGVLVIQIVVINILKYVPKFVEDGYSNAIYLFISKTFRYTFGWLPFSFGDTAYTLGAILILRWVIHNRVRIYKDTINWFADILAVVSLVYFVFHVFWGFNYYRPPLNTMLNLKADYSTAELITTTEKLIKKSNAIHNLLVKNDTLNVVVPYATNTIFSMVPDGYAILSKTYPELIYQPTSIKTSLYSLPLTYMGFSGYINPFTNEAQVNGLIPTYKIPTTACHEVAHQLGFAAENEANFIGALAAIHNSDTYFQYSGYTFALRYCLAELYKRDTDIYQCQLETINRGIIKNYTEVRAFWNAYQNPLEPAFKKTFDTFLKANNQSKGIKSYSYVVALLVNYYQTHAL